MTLATISSKQYQEITAYIQVYNLGKKFAKTMKKTTLQQFLDIE